MNRDKHAAFQSMPKFLCATALLLILCVPLNANLLFSFELFEADGTTPLAQPIMVNDTFVAAMSVQDTSGIVGGGAQAVLYAYAYDTGLLTQDGPLTLNALGGWSNVGGTTTTPTGGTVEAFTFTVPATGAVVEVARSTFTGDSTGAAVFTMAGAGGPGATFVTHDGRGWDAAGNCVTLGPAPDPDCTGEVVQFGAETVNIVPEPASVAMLLIGIVGFLARRR